MAVYYVSTLGSDANPGSMASPWLTLQKAANTVVAGDTVHVLVTGASPPRTAAAIGDPSEVASLSFSTPPTVTAFFNLLAQWTNGTCVPSAAPVPVEVQVDVWDGAVSAVSVAVDDLLFSGDVPAADVIVYGGSTYQRGSEVRDRRVVFSNDVP